MKQVGTMVGMILAILLAAIARAPAVTNAPAAAGAVATPDGADLDQLFACVQELQADRQWNEAVAVFQRILAIDGTNESALFGLGTVHIQLGDFKAALPLLEQVRRRQPDHPSVLNNLAWIHARSADPAIRDPAKALRYARQAVVTMPSDQNFWNTLAEAYFAAGDFDRALRVAKQSLRLARVNGETDLQAALELVERCRAAGAAAPLDPSTAQDKRERQDEKR